MSLALFPSFSQGQEYPTQTVQIIGCWPPGGFTTILAPMVSEEAKKYDPNLLLPFKPGAVNHWCRPCGRVAGRLHPAHGSVGHIVVAPFIQKLDYTPQDFEIMGQIALNPFTFCVRKRPLAKFKGACYLCKNESLESSLVGTPVRIPLCT